LKLFLLRLHGSKEKAVKWYGRIMEDGTSQAAGVRRPTKGRAWNEEKGRK